MRCICCKRILTAPSSIAANIGPECAKAFVANLLAAGSSYERIETLRAYGNASVNKWLHVALQAIAKGRKGDAEMFLQRAEREAAKILPRDCASVTERLILHIG